MRSDSPKALEVLSFGLLTSGVLGAWLPLLGHYQPVADDFPWIKIVRERGLIGYLRQVGPWRPLGQWTPVLLYNWHPWLIPLMSLGTHLMAVLLFFSVVRAMFGGWRLPIFVALIFGVFPLCYQAQTWMLATNYELLMPQFLAILLLLLRHDELTWPTGVQFALLFVLALSANLTNESLFFSIIFSGVIVLREIPLRDWLRDKRTALIAVAPAAGSSAWYLLQRVFIEPGMPKKMGFHLASLLSPYLRGDALFDVFWAWASPVTRGMLGSGWQGFGLLATWGCVTVFGLCTVALSFARNLHPVGARQKNFPFAPLALLVFGASLIYVFAGGFSPDSRKRYSLLPLWLMSAAWVYRAAVPDHKLGRSVGALVLLATGMAGIASTWLIIGIWKHEVACYNSLAQFIVDKGIDGEVQVEWNPDVYRAWPQFSRTQMFRLDENWTLDLAVEARGGKAVQVTSAPGVPDLVYDASARQWTLRR